MFVCCGYDMQKYHMWKHAEDGEVIVRTTSYGLPEALHEHVRGVQPTTMFGRFKKHKSSIKVFEAAPEISTSTGSIVSGSGTSVDASCNSTITVTCLKVFPLSLFAGYVCVA